MPHEDTVGARKAVDLGVRLRQLQPGRGSGRCARVAVYADGTSELRVTGRRLETPSTAIARF
jgi:hypothetical protein